MYFHAVKSTAHPPFIGALGHSTDCIVKQSYTFAFVQACSVKAARMALQCNVYRLRS